MPTKSFLRRSHRAVDQWLEKLGFYRKCVARDETCLFRIVSEQLYHTQILHWRVREDVVRYMEMHSNILEHFINGDYDDYVDKLRNHLIICGQVEISIVSLLYGRDVIIFNPTNYQIKNLTERNLNSKFYFCRTSDDHYDGIFPLKTIETAAFCQSMIYELLYEKVFDVEDTGIIVNLMLHYDTEGSIIETNNSSVSNTINRQDRLRAVENILVEHGRKKDDLSSALTTIIDDGFAPFSYKVAKALDPNIYRNIEFDSWNEMRKEIRYNQWYKGGEDLTEGVRCLVNLNPLEKKYCYIQKMPTKIDDEEDPECIVYIEDMAEICSVRRSQLEPMPHAAPWPLPLKTYRHIYKETLSKKNMKKAGKMRPKTCKSLDFSDSSFDKLKSSTKSLKKEILNTYASLQAWEPLEYTVMPVNTYTNNPQRSPTPNSGDWNDSSNSDQTAVSPYPAPAQLNPLPVYGVYEPTVQFETVQNAVPQNGSQYLVVGNNSVVDLCSNTLETVNYNSQRSVFNNGSDLPYNDISTLRFFYNIGIDHFRNLTAGNWVQHEINQFGHNSSMLPSSETPAIRNNIPPIPQNIWPVCVQPIIVPHQNPPFSPIHQTIAAPNVQNINLDSTMQNLTLTDESKNSSLSLTPGQNRIKQVTKKSDDKANKSTSRQWTRSKNTVNSSNKSPQKCHSTPISHRSNSENSSGFLNNDSLLTNVYPPSFESFNNYVPHFEQVQNYVVNSTELVQPTVIHPNCYPQHYNPNYVDPNTGLQYNNNIPQVPPSRK